MKKTNLKKRSFKFRKNIKNKNLNRLIIYRTSKHIYTQIIENNGKVIVSCSTLNKNIKEKLNGTYTGNKKSSEIIGENIAKLSINKNINNLLLDCSGFKFHGRIKSLVESAIKNGLSFNNKIKFNE